MRSGLLLWAGRDGKRQLDLGQVTPISLLGVREAVAQRLLSGGLN